VARCMSIKELEKAIMNLSVKELSELTAWLIEYRQQVWDRQIEEDLEGGRLDALLDEVDGEYEAGLAEAV
jgi:BioD-like phosphotransacetylase family protein